ncbi:hypothetical protein [Deinococcus aluminii]|uniref:Uncharacterized protein n=1 Tax=Deinococcus aluminii TaxID=1656885 RepID=A0ABP9XA20_9DEIO
MWDLNECGARRLYEVSRDHYAPALVAFAVRWLDDLAAQPDSVALCLGRDGIAPFVAARQLLRLASPRFRAVHPWRVQLAYLSRPLAAGATAQAEQAALLDRYLRALGAERGRPLVLVDVGVHGSIQDCLQQVYPGRDVRGHYLVLRRRAGDHNGERKWGFLADLDVIPRPERDHPPSWPPPPGWDLGGVLRGGDPLFLQRRSIHLLEDLWNGVGAVAQTFRVSRGDGRVGVVRGQPCEGPDLPPVLPIPQADWRRLKRAALWGVADGVARGRRLDGAAPGLAAWFRELATPTPVDAYLTDALVRRDRH